MSAEARRAKADRSAKSSAMKYVYILTSRSTPGRTYVGLTGDPQRRLREHNGGKCAHTRKYKPWDCTVAIRFEDDRRAMDFEAYLKTGSGRAFRNRHFL